MKIFGSLVRLTLIFAVAFALGAIFMFWRAVNAPATAGYLPLTLTVQQGEGPRVIAKELQGLNLLKNDRPFYLYVLTFGKRNNFYPGTYEIKPNASIRQIVTQLTSGKVNALIVRVLEGWRINDIADEVGQKTKVSGAAFKTAAPVAQYEGYLFPDTYSFTPETTAEQMVKIMHDNFDKRTAGLNLSKDQVIIASIVEREAKHDEDRPKIAGLYLNRLKLGMALEADPTVQYAKGSWSAITLADYRSVISPYNTYLNAGLPPTPIANAGLKSLTAAAQPVEHNYYYFFNLSDGSTIYSKTVAEHNANKAKYLH